MTEKFKVELTGIPETMLWPLHYRVEYARKNPSFLEDPIALELVDTIDYDFSGKFGTGHVGHSIRARYGDDLIRAFHDREGDRTVVVALGEGLETQAWRINRPAIRWITVDLPEAIKVRRDLLPTEKNHRLIGCSALEPDWLDEISSDDKVFISATGLFMYFESGQVQGLLREIATRAPTAELYFDCIPPGFSARAMKGMQVTPQYKAPKMPWGISIDHIPNFLAQSGWDTIAAITYAQPYPEYMKFYSILSRIGPVRRALAPGLVHATVLGSKTHLSEM